MTTGMEASVTMLWWTSIWMCRESGAFSSSHLDYLHCAHFSEICQDTVRFWRMQRTLHLPLLWPLFLVFRSTGDIENPRIPRGALHSIDMWWRGNRWQPRWYATSAHNYSISRIGVVDDTCLTWLGYFRCVNVLLCSNSLFELVGGGRRRGRLIANGAYFEFNLVMLWSLSEIAIAGCCLPAYFSPMAEFLEVDSWRNNVCLRTGPYGVLIKVTWSSQNHNLWANSSWFEFHLEQPSP